MIKVNRIDYNLAKHRNESNSNRKIAKKLPAISW